MLALLGLRRGAALGSHRVLGAAVRSPSLAAAGCLHLQPFSMGFAGMAASAKYSTNNTQAQPSLGFLALVAGGTIANVVSELSEPAACMGKRKKKDSDMGDDMYEVDHIVARKLEKGQPKYLIRWRGYNEKDDTWEPLANLCGFEPDVAAFEAKQKKDNEEFARQLAERKAAKERAKAADKAKAMLPGAGAGGGGAAARRDHHVVTSSCQPSPEPCFWMRHAS